MQRAKGHRSRPHLCFLHHFALAFCWEGQGTRPARLLRPREQRIATLPLFVHTGYHWLSLPMSVASISRASSCLPTLYSVPIHSTKGCTRDTGCEHRQTKPSRGVRAVSLCFQSPQPHSRPRARCAGSLDRLPLSPTVSSNRSSLAPWTLDAFPRARSRQEAVRVPKASTSATYVWMLGN
jgi:hypothetical protein